MAVETDLNRGEKSLKCGNEKYLRQFHCSRAHAVFRAVVDSTRRFADYSGRWANDLSAVPPLGGDPGNESRPPAGELQRRHFCPLAVFVSGAELPSAGRLAG